MATRPGGQTTYAFDGDAVVEEIGPSGIIYHVPGVGYAVSADHSSTYAQNYYQANALGSALSVRAGVGSLQSQNEYDAYGITYTTVAGPQSEFRFAGAHGYQSDNETGLDLLEHRYYVPQLGRFLTQDPSGQDGGLNLYGYAGNNPVSRVDPTGLAEVEVRYRAVVHPGFHAFLIITGNDGKQYYISGGPAYEINHADQSRIRDHLLTVNEGIYKAGTPDWPSGNTKESDRPESDVLIKDDKPASYYIDAFMRVGNQINDSRITYTWYRNSSNATIREILQRSNLGLPIPGPSNQPRDAKQMWHRPWTTAWDNSLPIR